MKIKIIILSFLLGFLCSCKNEQRVEKISVDVDGVYQELGSNAVSNFEKHHNENNEITHYCYHLMNNGVPRIQIRSYAKDENIKKFTDTSMVKATYYCAKQIEGREEFITYSAIEGEFIVEAEGETCSGRFAFTLVSNIDMYDTLRLKNGRFEVSHEVVGIIPAPAQKP